MWGSKFGKELWESLTVATRRDTIQQVKMAITMIWRIILLIMRVRVDTVVDEHSIESTAAIALAFLVLSYYLVCLPCKMFMSVNQERGINSLSKQAG